MFRERTCGLGPALITATALCLLSLAIPTAAFAEELDAPQRMSSAVVNAIRHQMQATDFKPVLVEEGRSQSKCEAVANRIFVTTSAGSECISYFVTRGFEQRRQAVLFFNGDFSKAQATEAAAQRSLEGSRKFMQFWADQLKVRYIYVSRVGLQGSSGNHGDRRFPKETIVMNAVADGLKARLGLDDLALAGQSGGSTIAISLVTMGRKDVKCAVSGSGPLELVDQQYAAGTRLGFDVVKAAVAANVYDPATHVGSVVPRRDRRIFVLGDPLDTEVPYKFQAPFVDRVKAAGHHAMAIAVEGLGAKHHDVVPATLPVAGVCLNNASDEIIARRAVELAHAQIRGQAQALAQAHGQRADKGSEE
jgi:hypothetical protein